MTRPVPSASCRVHVELFVENATPADTHRAIIIPPPNQALADPSLPLYSALSLSLPLPSLPLSHPIPLFHGSLDRPFTPSLLCLLAWDPNFIPRYHIWATHLLTAKTHLNSTRSSLGYQRKKLPSAIRSYSFIYCPSFLLPCFTTNVPKTRLNIFYFSMTGTIGSLATRQ